MNDLDATAHFASGPLQHTVVFGFEYQPPEKDRTYEVGASKAARSGFRGTSPAIWKWSPVTPT
jgi:hypothetical protein